MRIFHRICAGVGLVAALGSVLVGGPVSAQSLAGVTFPDGQLIPNGQFLSMNGSDGTAAQTGAFAAGVRPDGLAAYNGSLYTFDAGSNNLLQLNAATGATVASFNVGLSGITGPIAPGGLAISSSGRAFLAVPLANSSLTSPSSALFVFSSTGGPALSLGRTNDLLSSLAFSADDTLYGLGKGDGQLYTINTADARATLVGNLGSLTVPDPFNPGATTTTPIDADPIGALGFSGGTLYAAADGNLYTVSTSTGAATVVNPSLINTGFGGNFANVSGLVAAPVPEADSAVSFGALLALGGVFVLRRRTARPH